MWTLPSEKTLSKLGQDPREWILKSNLNHETQEWILHDVYWHKSQKEYENMKSVWIDNLFWTLFTLQGS